MARVQLADLRTRSGWVPVTAKGISVLYHRGSWRVSVGGVQKSAAKIPWGSGLQVLEERYITREEMVYGPCPRDARGLREI